jgi:murein tripeptide amidase MpaA
MLGKAVDVRVNEAQYPWMEDTLMNQGMSYSVMIEDVQKLIDGQKTRADDFFSQYNPYQDIIAWVKTLPTQFPDLVTLVPLGNSYQGRELLAVKITYGAGNKPAVWFDGLLHAREWISGGVTIWMLNQLLNDFNHDLNTTALITNLEIWVLPVFNPDGYAYTWGDNRMWRKTRSPNPGSTCIGTDPNRNWDFEWGGEGVSRDPCNDAYLGSAAFSEIEVKTVGLYIKNLGNMKGYINFHSYSQLWMSPWGYTATRPPDYTVQNNLGGRCVAALKAVNGVTYEYGCISVIIYPASGSSADYTYGAANVVYSYGVELRDLGQYGFLLPPAQIVPSGEETYAAFKVFAWEVLATYGQMLTLK